MTPLYCTATMVATCILPYNTYEFLSLSSCLVLVLPTNSLFGTPPHEKVPSSRDILPIIHQTSSAMLSWSLCFSLSHTCLINVS